MADAPAPPPRRPASAAVLARRERARLRALPTPSSASAPGLASGKRAREAEPPPPEAKAAPQPQPKSPGGAPRKPSAAERAAYDSAEASRAALRAAQKRVGAAQAQCVAAQAQLLTSQETLRAAQAAHALAEAAAVALGGGGAEAAYSRRGELFLDVIGLVAARGYAAEVSQCRALCGLTWRRGDRGATNDMIVSSLRLQCGAVAAREAVRESFTFVWPGDGSLRAIEGSTQLIRASIQNNLPRVLQLIQVGAPLDLVDQRYCRSALHWASAIGHEHVVAALLEGKYKGADVEQVCRGNTALELVSSRGRVGIVRVLLARGAKQVRPGQTCTPIFWAAYHNHIEVVKLLLAAPGASDALKTKHGGRTPLKWAIDFGHAEMVALLRAAGAPE